MRNFIYVYNSEEATYYGWFEDAPNIIGEGNTIDDVMADVRDSERIVNEHLQQISE